jgi:hypothetical protein
LHQTFGGCHEEPWLYHEAEGVAETKDRP